LGAGSVIRCLRVDFTSTFAAWARRISSSRLCFAAAKKLLFVQEDSQRGFYFDARETHVNWRHDVASVVPTFFAILVCQRGAIKGHVQVRRLAHLLLIHSLRWEVE
jgi:hypothetical protein